MILSDLREVKAYLDIPPGNLSEDVKLSLFIEVASEWLQEVLNRQLTYAQRTEFYNGTGTQKLLLKSRPVFLTPPLQVYVDEGGYWGSVTGSFDPNLTLLT